MSKREFTYCYLFLVLFTLYSWIGPKTYDDVDARHFIENFEQECHCYANLDIKFVSLNDMPDEVVGVCRLDYYLLAPHIEIRKEYFDKLTYYEKEHLIFHEMGHCYLLREHVTKKLKNGWPTSIMYPELFDYPAEIRSYYMNELFGRH